MTFDRGFNETDKRNRSSQGFSPYWKDNRIMKAHEPDNILISNLQLLQIQ